MGIISAADNNSTHAGIIFDICATRGIHTFGILFTALLSMYFYTCVSFSLILVGSCREI